MSQTRPLFSLILLVAAAVGAMIATATPVAASDCGADYIQCLNDTGSLLNSDQLHEEECYADYTDCVARLILFY